MQDILEEVAAGLSVEAVEGNSRKVGFRVKGNQIILGAGFIPPTTPGSYKNGDVYMPVPHSEVHKMLYGPTVSLAVKDKTLTEIVDLLREQTGANIVLDHRFVQLNPDDKLTLTLNDAKLFTVLKVAGHMCDLAPAVVDNVFYLTDPAKAAKLQAETEKNLFGELPAPPVAIPAGYVTDGVNLYLRPANLTPAGGHGFGGSTDIGGGVGGSPGIGGFVPAKPEPAKPEAPKADPGVKKQ